MSFRSCNTYISDASARSLSPSPFSWYQNISMHDIDTYIHIYNIYTCVSVKQKLNWHRSFVLTSFGETSTSFQRCLLRFNTSSSPSSYKIYRKVIWKVNKYNYIFQYFMLFRLTQQSFDHTSIVFSCFIINQWIQLLLSFFKKCSLEEKSENFDIVRIKHFPSKSPVSYHSSRRFSIRLSSIHLT